MRNDFAQKVALWRERETGRTKRQEKERQGNKTRERVWVGCAWCVCVCVCLCECVRVCVRIFGLKLTVSEGIQLVHRLRCSAEQ